MASVNVLNVKIMKNPAAFSDLLQFEITFECLCPLDEGIFSSITFLHMTFYTLHPFI